MTAPSTDITALPDDVLLVIFEHLPTRTIAIARQTCKAFQRVSHSKQLWLSVMRRDVLRNNLPVPAYCRHTDSLSGRECEVIVVNALCVSEHLRCGGSRPQAPHVVTAHQSRSVTWVKMIRGQWLLVACSDGSSSVLCLLSVALLSELGAAACPAAQTYLEGPVARGLVDVQETNRLVIAVELRAQSRTSVLFLSLLEADSNLAFVCLGRFYDDISHIRDLRGDRLAFALHRDRSLPSVLNWRTGEVVNLCSVPNIDGGAVSMCLDDALVVVVTPRELQVWTPVHTPASQTSYSLHAIPFDHPVGFASCIIRPSVLGTSSGTLPVALSGQSGIFVYSIGENRLRNDVTPDDLSLIWHLGRADPMDATSKRRFDDPYLPLLGDGRGGLSWLVGSYTSWHEFRRHVRFATLPDGLPHSAADMQDDAPAAEEYQLDHPDMPALYAAGVYDYDDGLGLAVFGNAFGELALFRFGGIPLRILNRSFQPVVFQPAGSNFELMPASIVRSTCFPPFPYAGPLIPAQPGRATLIYKWRARQPGHIPEPWGREGDVEADDAAESALDWFYYVPRIPTEVEDIGWDLERSWHFYGDIVPLVSNDWVRIFSAGGLLFVFVVDDTLHVIPPGTSLDDLLVSFQHYGTGGPSYRRQMDRSAFNVGTRFYEYWLWECDHRGRNRWKELEDRGGEVHRDWTDDTARPRSPPI